MKGAAVLAIAEAAMRAKQEADAAPAEEPVTHYAPGSVEHMMAMNAGR
jgi:hypothetical protein